MRIIAKFEPRRPGDDADDREYLVAKTRRSKTFETIALGSTEGGDIAPHVGARVVIAGEPRHVKAVTFDYNESTILVEIA